VCRLVSALFRAVSILYHIAGGEVELTF